MLSDDELLMLRPRQEEPGDDWLSALIAQETAAPEQAAPPDPRARVRELVAQRQTPAPTGPGERESAYTSTVEKPGDGNRWLAVLGSLLSGQDFVGMRDARRAQYQEGLLKAREMDAAQRRASRPVDAPTAEMGTIAGLSPESAADLREDSPALKLFNNLGMVQTRQRGQDLAHEEKQKALESRTSDLEKRLAAQKEMSADKNETSLERQRIANQGKKGHGGGHGAPMTPEQKEAAAQDELSLNAAYIADSAGAGGRGVTLEQAKALLTGTLDEASVDPTTLERMKKDAIFLTGLKAGEPKKYYELIKAGAVREATNTDKPAVAARVKSEDPKEQFRLRTEIGNVGADVGAAWRAWENLTPAAKDAISKFGGGGGFIGDFLQKASLSAEDQVAKQQLQALANALIKARAGSAVTGTEWNRVAAEIGFAQRDFDLLNSPETIGAWLRKSKDAWAREVRNVKEIYGKDFFTRKVD